MLDIDEEEIRQGELQTGDRWSNQCGCFVRRLDYDFVLREGVLWMGHGSCTDMSGCIRLFLAIDFDVQFIVTMGGRGCVQTHEINPPV